VMGMQQPRAALRKGEGDRGDRRSD
jgi:hypothetical protein